MLSRVAKIFGTGVLLVASAFAQQPQSQWKDRAEYDMFQEILKETDPAKKIEKVKAWRDKYPESNFKKAGMTLILTSYVQLNKGPEVAKAAKDILAADSLDVTALFYLASMAKNATDPDILNAGEKASNMLTAESGKVFAPERKPEGTDAAAWAKAKSDMEILGLKTLSYIVMQRKDYEKAETAIKHSLDKNPNDGEAAYWMYTVIRAMKKPERSSDALFYLARAASLTADKGGLPDANRKQVGDFFVKAYNGYHGQDDAGMKDLRALALERTTPPDAFKIKDAQTIASEKEEEFKKSNPQLAFWMHLKQQLTGGEGEKFFETMKGAALPGKIEGTEYTMLKGKLVSMKPAANPKELVLLLDTTQNAAGSAGEVTLKFEAPLRGKADPGTDLEFEGIADAFTKDPFMVTFLVEKEKLTGWPVQAAAPPAAKKAAGGATKKGGAAVRKKK